MKKLSFLALLTFCLSLQSIIASDYFEPDLGFIDLELSIQPENAAKVAHLKVFEKELEEAITSSTENQDPKKCFEQKIYHQNQEYISSLGLLY